MSVEGTPAKKKSGRKPKAKAAPPETKEPKDICFTIMPFRGWFDRYYEEIFYPAIIAAGLQPHRADDLFRPSTIVGDIWDYTKRAKVILADLTGKNPNVFYELGLAHALSKPAVIVVETIDDIPFDLKGLRIIEYDKNCPSWDKILEVKITNSIREVLASPAESVPKAFIDVKPSDRGPAVTEDQKELAALRQDVEALKQSIRQSSISNLQEKLRRLGTHFDAGLMKDDLREPDLEDLSPEAKSILHFFPIEWVSVPQIASEYPAVAQCLMNANSKLTDLIDACRKYRVPMEIRGQTLDLFAPIWPSQQQRR